MKRFPTLALTVSLLCLCAATNPVYADGMPFKEKKKTDSSLTPLDKALSEIQKKSPDGKTEEAPVDVTKPPEQKAPVVAEEPKKEEPKKEEVAVVPESRVIEVQPNSSFFGLSVGMYDPFTHGKPSPSFNLEWQPGVKIAGVVQPIFGGFITTQGSMMGYGGVGVPVKLGEHFMLMPSVAVGAYGHGNGVDLRRRVAYRVGSELAYVFDDKSRIGLNAHVITNGISLERRDRTEVIGLTYTTPLDIFSGSSNKQEAVAPHITPTDTEKPVADDMPAGVKEAKPE